LSQVSQAEENNEAEKLVVDFLTDLESKLIERRAKTIERAFNEIHANDLEIHEKVKLVKQQYEQHLLELLQLVGQKFNSHDIQKMEDSVSEFQKIFSLATTHSFEFVLSEVEESYKEATDSMKREHQQGEFQDFIQSLSFFKWGLLDHCTSGELAQFKLLYQQGLIEKYGEPFISRFDDDEISKISRCVDQVRSLYATKY
jgi:Cdc6-like AAA superfamily ATPase